MPYFGEKFLEDLRAALPVLSVVQRRHKMRKRGAHEYVAIDDNSLTVSTEKNIWNDFSKQRGGDILDFEQFDTGCTFEQAVETLAKLAGLPLPGGRGSRNATTRETGIEAPEPPPPSPSDSYAGQAPAPQKTITAAYDYRDSDTALVYQVVRMEWVEGGKKRKTFLQRRPAPGAASNGETGLACPGPWVWGLSDGAYLQGRNGDWYQATKDRIARWATPWAGAAQIELEGTAHGLYRLPELREEMAQEPHERRVVMLTEGEKDADTLAAWGIVSTTNSGGVSNWRAHHAEELRDADVVILTDNDTAGRERGQTIAISLRGIAKRVRVLDWFEHWRGAPEKADVTDWRDKANGTSDKLFAIIDKLPDWSPQAPESKFGALRFTDLDRPRKQLQWLIKRVMTRGEMSIWYGDYVTGKSFLLVDAAFAIARGVTWMGQRTRLGLVIYQCGEGGIGFGNRMLAYRMRYGIKSDEPIPFVALTTRINVHSDDADVERLIVELKGWAAYYDTPLELVVIDTFSAATPGADENLGRDVGPVLERCRRIATETGAHVAVVHHVPKSGSGPRGWSGFLGNVDSGIFIEKTDQMHDESKLAIRRFTVTKQKDAESNFSAQFVLRAMVVGHDVDNEEVTSCVIQPIGENFAEAATKSMPVGWYNMSRLNAPLFLSLDKALKKGGRPLPPDVTGPDDAIAIKISEWQAMELERVFGHEEITQTIRSRIRKRLQRACDDWGCDGTGARLIVKNKEWVWRTDRKVYGVDRLPSAGARSAAAVPPREDINGSDRILAPGEDPRDFGETLQ